MKLHLPAKPANEGARLLGRRILAAHRGNLPMACRTMRIPVSTLQRLVDGEIVPGEDLVAQVAHATRDAIARADWRRPARGGWFDLFAPIKEVG